MQYAVRPDGTGRQSVFDMTAAEGEEALDGLKVDEKGNLYVSGPGGLWILSAEGRHLGTIVGPEHPHNFAWAMTTEGSLSLRSDWAVQDTPQHRRATAIDSSTAMMTEQFR